MSQLPKGWAENSLGNLVVVERGSSPRPIKNFLTDSDDGVNWIKIGDAKKGQKLLTSTAEKITKEGAMKSRFVDVGDFILSNSMSFGLPYIMGIPGYIHDGWFVFRLPKQISSDYFYYLLSSSYVGAQFNNLAVGGVVKNISGDLVKKAILPLPPLAEQTRIVEKLDEVLAQVDTIKARLDGIPAIIKRFRQSVLAAAVSGKLTEEWRDINTAQDIEKFCSEITDVRKEQYLVTCQKAKLAKSKKPRKPSNIDDKIEPHLDVLDLLPSIPEQWTQKVLSFVTDNYADSIVDGPFGASINVKTDYIDDGVPVIRMVNIRPFQFLRENRKFVSFEKFEGLSRHKINEGDVLFAKVGATTGDCCMYPMNEPIAMLSTTGSCRITVDKQVYNSEFLVIVLNAYRRIFNSITSQVAQPFLNMKTIKSVPIPIPALEEQKEIVRLVDQYFSFADTIEAQVKKAQARVDSLTQSILAKAFRGELVAQDPSDEPADKLLERIAQARIEAEALAKAAKKIEANKKRAAKKASA
ncbi:restriction endonuclease subunit S [Photobacterium profundum]|uniref:Type I restriction-modification system, S subunit n=1 Tax=Photobacterium profundum 3TCK TaxID=314280 RepID=Q1Z9T4_9GAMM|nr:restriction endonuclease subunit S [Photobacterium profundum]EAS45758.1 type I restriction-modification system, S subunit [Photobacterium profundum 3TCK]